MRRASGVCYDPLGPVHPMSTPATATPVADGERVYAYFVQVGLFVYNDDGTPVWKLPLPTAQVRFGSGTSPVLVGDLLVLNRDAIATSSLLPSTAARVRSNGRSRANHHDARPEFELLDARRCRGSDRRPRHDDVHGCEW